MLHNPKSSLPAAKASSLHSFWEVHPDHLMLTLLKSNRTVYSSAQPFFHLYFPFRSLLHLINVDANQPKSRPGADLDKYNLEEARTEKELILQQGSEEDVGEHK